MIYYHLLMTSTYPLERMKLPILYKSYS